VKLAALLKSEPPSRGEVQAALRDRLETAPRALSPIEELAVHIGEDRLSLIHSVIASKEIF
jgi:hypothetical protein